ncbi:SDR family oxidoreductase [Nocardia callitridis]|uniref:SDR family oxidoreductase n=1 Tax=Nocardia callitridis TaxID=648753 RepID=UPI0031E84C93
MVEEVLAADPRLDVLVNNVVGGEASGADLVDPFGGSAEAWDHVLGLNLLAAVETTRAALPALTRSRGAVVNTGSSSARDPRGVPLSYAATKAGLDAFPEGWRKRVRNRAFGSMSLPPAPPAPRCSRARTATSAGSRRRSPSTRKPWSRPCRNSREW